MSVQTPDQTTLLLTRLHERFEHIRTLMHEADEGLPPLVRGVRPEHLASARNLVHYLALRHHDIRAVQEDLRRVGLSSLGRCEPAVLRTVDAVLDLLRRLSGVEEAPGAAPPSLGFDEAEALRRERAAALLGPPPPERDVSIMVTMPSAAAEHPGIVRDLVDAGMDVMRINAAHDEPADWASMVGHLRATDGRGGERCRIMVDLPGPKLRTSELDVPLRLAAGDRLELRRADVPGRRAVLDSAGGTLAPAVVGCRTPAALERVEPGHRVWFDDGKIGAIVRDVHGDRVDLEIVGGADVRKLRGNKGINLPDTPIGLPALGPADESALAFAAEHADGVALSFVRGEADVLALQRRLAQLGAEDRLGIILKIETRDGFNHLPGVMLAAMRGGSVGVMIARGDLAVEVGYERLAEVQEEILWMCEAAHMPVIWATQVLEGLAKTGTASRAEITDAAMAQRAECVMLNKGPYIVHAVHTLDDILRRMQRHQLKKRPVLRPLGVARRFFG